MAASRAITKAGCTSWGSRFQSTSGRLGMGSPCGSSPNREPMVSTGRLKHWHTSVLTSMPTSMNGAFGHSRFVTRITTTVSTESPSAQ